MQLKDQVAFVTGAGSGIGRAAALRLAREGARVAIVARDQEELNAAVRDIENNGGAALAIVADVGIAADMERAVKETTDRWGRLDIVFANAGVNGVWAALEDLTPDEWESTLRTNLTGTFLTVKYAVPWLKKQGGAVIVTASVNGTRIFSNTGATAYSCSKAGQVAFTKMTALELAPHKVRVNVICPGAIETKIEESTEHRNLEKIRIPVEYPEGSLPLEGKPGTAEQVADLVVFLASPGATHITGTEIWIDGAESLLRG